MRLRGTLRRRERGKTFHHGERGETRRKAGGGGVLCGMVSRCAAVSPDCAGGGGVSGEKKNRVKTEALAAVSKQTATLPAEE